MAFTLTQLLNSMAFIIRGKSLVSLAAPSWMVAVMLTLASLSVGTGTPPELLITSGLLEVQVMSLPLMPSVGRTRLCCTLVAVSQGP